MGKMREGLENEEDSDFSLEFPHANFSHGSDSRAFNHQNILARYNIPTTMNYRSDHLEMFAVRNLNLKFSLGTPHT